jgi:hypothetical protein
MLWQLQDEHGELVVLPLAGLQGVLARATGRFERGSMGHWKRDGRRASKSSWNSLQTGLWNHQSLGTDRNLAEKGGKRWRQEHGDTELGDPFGRCLH